MALFTREQMISELQTSVCEVFFKKRDGAIREMICTLDANRAPALQIGRMTEASNTASQKVSPTVIPVWDIEKMAWRSFRVDSVIYFNAQGTTPEDD